MSHRGRLAVVVSVLAVALAGSASVARATFPGRNGRIAFMAWPSGPPNIFSAKPDGTDVTRLTSGPAQDAHPAWSPDGSKIAFASDRVLGNGQTDIYVMDADGTDVMRLTTEATGPAHPVGSRLPAWSPDGTRIAFVSDRADPRGDVWVMNADGSRQVDLTPSAGADSYPAWSPDGTRIAFVSDRGGDDQIYTMDPGGGRQAPLTSDPGPPRASLDWSPDGTRLVVARDPDRVYVMRADGTGARRLTAGMNAVWSPDGTRILYTIQSPLRLATIAPDGTGLTTLPLAGDYADWQRLPAEPQRSDYRNASQYCEALRAFLGASGFGARYRNHGACVSANHRSLR